MSTVNGSCKFVHRVVNEMGRADHVLLHGFHLLAQVVVALEIPRELLRLELLKV